MLFIHEDMRQNVDVICIFTTRAINTSGGVVYNFQFQQRVFLKNKDSDKSKDGSATSSTASIMDEHNERQLHA